MTAEKIGNGVEHLTTSGKFEIDGANNHSAMLGLRYALWTPPAPVAAPPVVPQAPQAVARTYLVFFDWDRYNLTDRARQIITEAAQNARSTGSTRIEVAGHADRSGTPQYNMGLSRRRAEAVRDYLIAAGVLNRPWRSVFEADMMFSIVAHRWLAERPDWVRGKRVLDFGAGSGVAAIAAAKAGASALVLADPSSVAWSFNIRGEDLPSTPHPLSRAIIPASGRPQLFSVRSSASMMA